MENLYNRKYKTLMRESGEHADMERFPGLCIQASISLKFSYHIKCIAPVQSL